MKNLIITLEYPPQSGGIASFVYNLAAHLPPEKTIVYALKQSDDLKFDALHPWKTYRLRPYWNFIWPRWLRLFFQILILVRQEKIDQIYLHHVLPVGYVAYLMKKIFKIPYAVFLHGTDISMAVSVKSKRNKFVRLCKSAQTVVVNSDFLKNKFLDIVENHPDIRVVYPCPSDYYFNQKIDENKLAALRARLALSGKKVIITVSRLVEGKGFPHLAALFLQILKSVPNAVWLIIGEGEKKKEIFKIIEKNNLQNVVRYMGAVEAEELPKFYNLADLFVLLTHKDENKEEGWGTVFLEAAACGLPVVAGRVGGVEEAVLDGQTGLVVDVYQKPAVLEAIVKLLTNEELLQQYGQAGKERVNNYFRWQNEIQKLK